MINSKTLLCVNIDHTEYSVSDDNEKYSKHFSGCKLLCGFSLLYTVFSSVKERNYLPSPLIFAKNRLECFMKCFISGFYQFNAHFVKGIPGFVLCLIIFKRL